MLAILRTYNDRPCSETRPQRADGPSLVAATRAESFYLTTYPRIPVYVYRSGGSDYYLKSLVFHYACRKEEGKKKKRKKKAATLVMEMIPVHNMISQVWSLLLGWRHNRIGLLLLWSTNTADRLKFLQRSMRCSLPLTHIAVRYYYRIAQVCLH